MKVYADFNHQREKILSLYPSQPTKKIIETVNKLILENGLYRTKGFIKPFLAECNITKNLLCTRDIEHIEKVSNFDYDLRVILTKYLLIFEMKISLKISDYLSKRHTPYWNTEASIFSSTSNYQHINNLINDCSTPDVRGAHSHPGVASYYRKHGARSSGGGFKPTNIPSWIFKECVSFGFWSDLLYALDSRKVEGISSGIPVKKKNGTKTTLDAQQIRSWVISLKTLRNMCAHNSLIINRSLAHNPAVFDNYYPETQSGSNLGSRVIILSLLLGSLDKNTLLSFSNELVRLLERYRDLLGEADLLKISDLSLRSTSLCTALGYVPPPQDNAVHAEAIHTETSH